MNPSFELFALSPLDGRYKSQVNDLALYFSEGALIKYRIRLESFYLIKLLEFIRPGLEIEESKKEKIINLWKNLTEQDLQKIKTLENKINHDMKAVEYFIKSFLFSAGMEELTEWVHFGLTSEDINNLAYSLMLKDALNQAIKPLILELIKKLTILTERFASIPMLSRTHGQPASPTTIGKETGVFLNRILDEYENLLKITLKGKLNGATGNYNAFYVSFPDLDWIKFSEQFISSLDLVPNLITTQIEPHDKYAELFDCLSRINNILTDMAVDMWHYISLGYFVLEKKQEEVGSSTMPHKINPVDFENCEGNLGLANSILEFMKNKLTKSRLQRDLSDSTVLRNIGSAFGYSVVGYKSILKGLGKISPSEETIKNDLENHNEVLAEGIQTILRAEGIEKPYELMKDLTRGNKISLTDIHDLINKLEISEDVRQKLKNLRTSDYTGVASNLAYQVVSRAKNLLLFQ